MSAESAIETRDLRLVQAIAEHGSVTRAARGLHLSQSAVSHQLAGLEERLGVAVFDRVRKKMVITPAGRRLVALAQQVLPQLAQAQHELRAHAAAAPRPLRLTTQCYTAYHWLPRVLGQLAAAHPGLELQVHVEETRTPTEALLDDRLDVALCCFPSRDRRLVQTPLFDDEMVVVLPVGHRLASRPYLTGRELLDETLFFYEVPAGDEARVRRMLYGRSGAGARFRRVPLTEAIVELVRAGQGISFLARWSLGEHLARGGLVTRRLGPRGEHRTWSLVRPRSSPFVPELRTLVELLRAALGPSTPTGRGG